MFNESLCWMNSHSTQYGTEGPCKWFSGEKEIECLKVISWKNI